MFLLGQQGSFFINFDGDTGSVLHVPAGADPVFFLLLPANWEESYPQFADSLYLSETTTHKT